jgi:hypothetical protein
MGGVINVISRYTESKNTESFISEMKVPAIKLVAMYVSQVGEFDLILCIFLQNSLCSPFVHFFIFTCCLI